MKDVIKLKSKKRLFARLQGEHISPFGGSSIEFLELKEYNYLDNAKHINWERSAFANTPLVNIYSDDRELNIVVIYLVSASLIFKDKKDIAKEAVSILSYSATKFNEKLTLLFFSSDIELIFEGLRDGRSFDISYDSASKIEHLSKRVDYNSLSNFLNSYLKERSLIFLVGDFLDKDINLSALSFKHELFAIVVRDKNEESISAFGGAILKDPVTLKLKRLFISKKGANRYNKAMAKHDLELFNSFDRFGIRYTKLYKNSDILTSLKRLIDARD